MNRTKKMRGGFWNPFRKKDYSEEEKELFLIIQKIHEQLICNDVSLKQIFLNIERYLDILEYCDEMVKEEIKKKLDTNEDTNEDKVLYAFLILEKRQLRELGINLNKKLKSISGKRITQYVGYNSRETNENHLMRALNSVGIRKEIRPIVKKFCVKNFRSFYDTFYNYIRKFKLELSEHDTVSEDGPVNADNFNTVIDANVPRGKKEIIKQITKLFKKIYDIITNPTPNSGDSDDNSYDNSPDNSYNNSGDSYDNSDNSSLYDFYEELPTGGKRITKKSRIKKSLKLQKKITI